MYVFSFFKEIHIGLPTYNQVMIAVKCTYTTCVEFICITYQDISDFSP